MGNYSVIPVVILEDASGSTEQMRSVMDQQMSAMIRSLKQNPFSDRVELSAVHFDQDVCERTVWEPLKDIPDNVLDLKEPAGATNTGAALRHILNMIDEKKLHREKQGGRDAAPILLLLTDGPVHAGRNAPQSVRQQYEERYEEAAYAIKKREQIKELSFAAVGITQTARYKADADELKKLTEHPEWVFEAKVRFRETLDLSAPTAWLNEQIRQAGEALNREHVPVGPQKNDTEQKSAGRGRRNAQSGWGNAAQMPVYELCLDDTTLAFFDLKDGISS